MSSAIDVEEPPPLASRRPSPGKPASIRWHRSTAFKLFLTVWLLYVIHFATNVVRETYLAIALGDHFSIQVTDFLGLHPDLFEIKGRGAFINNNPGASILGAVPYALARPAIEGLLRLKPELARRKPPAQYNDPRPNRTTFFNEARARGLDIKLALAAASMQVGLMAPLGAAAAVAVYFFLRSRLNNERRAFWLALLYAFATPIFFRSAFLNQNAIVAHCVLFAYIIGAGPLARDPDEPIPLKRAALAGLLLGYGVLTDYSAVPLFIVFAAWVFADAFRGAERARSAVRAICAFGLGAIPPIAILMTYQWRAFGNPTLPAQSYMPATEYSVKGWNGFFWPQPDLLWGNLMDLQYGLLAFCPMLVLALVAPFLKRRLGGPSHRELWLVFGATLALYLFNSSVQFAYLQFNTGVRYMVPIVPLLFFALVPVLLRLPRFWLWVALIPTIAVSWSVSMAREDVPLSLLRVFLHGFELPWLTVLEKTASGYAPFLASGVSPIPVFCVTGVILWLLWQKQPERSARTHEE